MRNLITLLAWLTCVAAAAAQPAAAPSGTAPPDAAPDNQGWGVAAGLRYLEIVRGNAGKDTKLPLLIVLHGLGDQPSREWLTRIDVEADTPVRMILPQAPLPFPDGGFGWFAYRVGNLDQVSLARFVGEAADRLAQLIQVVSAQRPTRGRAVICGYSQGATLTYALWMRHPELVQFALPINGTLPAPLWPKEPRAGAWAPSLLSVHGSRDPVIRIDVDKQLHDRLRELGYDAKLVPIADADHRISKAMSELARETLTRVLKALRD